MIFNSWDFLVFLVFAFTGYRAVPQRFRNVWVTLSGLYFYSFWSIKFTSLIVISSVVDYFLAFKIEKSTSPHNKKYWLTLSILMNLGVLGFFKYFNFFTENVSQFFHVFGFDIPRTTLHIILPAGISFYTFQEMSYTIDIFRGKCKARTNYFDVGAYVAFFPPLMAGPIERSNHLMSQLENPRPFTSNDFWAGAQLALWGLFQKVVIADNIAHVVQYVFDTPSKSPDTGLALVGVYAFALQIFCDFSGYSDMARGIARWFGIDLIRNFNRPYVALSMRDFWSRWHISLSTWLRDYLYIPLGGNRCAPWRVYFNLIVTMLLGGLWHGATWLFVAWGLYHGILLAIEHALRLDPDQLRQKPFLERLPMMFVTFHAVCFGWVLFRCLTVEGFKQWCVMLTSGHFSSAYSSLWSALVLYVAPVALVWYLQAQRPEDDRPAVILPSWARTAFVAILLVGIVLLGSDKGREFIYFQF